MSESIKPKGFVGYYEVRIMNGDKLHEIRFIHAKTDAEAQITLDEIKQELKEREFAHKLYKDLIVTP